MYLLSKNFRWFFQPITMFVSFWGCILKCFFFQTPAFLSIHIWSKFTMLKLWGQLPVGYIFSLPKAHRLRPCLDHHGLRDPGGSPTKPSNATLGSAWCHGGVLEQPNQRRCGGQKGGQFGWLNIFWVIVDTTQLFKDYVRIPFEKSTRNFTESDILVPRSK